MNEKAKGSDTMLFLQYPPCSTCQKAKKWLDDHGIEYTARHIKEDNPTADELANGSPAAACPSSGSSTRAAWSTKIWA